VINKLELDESQAIIIQLELLLVHLPGETPVDVPDTVKRSVS